MGFYMCHHFVFKICFCFKGKLQKRITEKLAPRKGIQSTASPSFFFLITKTLSRGCNHLFPKGILKPFKLRSVEGFNKTGKKECTGSAPNKPTKENLPKQILNLENFFDSTTPSLPISCFS